MDTETIQTIFLAIFFCFLLLSGLLLIGLFLRARVKIIQLLFLPASVVGGFVGLLLGPILLKKYAIIPIPEDWLTIFSLLPGILIVPVIASIPLGVTTKSMNKPSKTHQKDIRSSIFFMFAILGVIGAIQNLVGVLTGGMFKYLFHYDNIYATFGTELSAGFAGGHGTAGVIANLLNNFNQSYWETAQGVTTTIATIGIISGVLIGILWINIAARRGDTHFIQSKTTLQNLRKSNIHTNMGESAGIETTDSSSIDSLSFHLALVLSVSGLAFLTTFIIHQLHIPLLGYIPEWGYAIVIMYIVWGVMQRANLSTMVDQKTTAKIRSTLTEYTIVAAIASLPLQAVSAYFLPILIMAFVGIISTILLTFYISKIVFPTYWFEKCMVMFGTSTGVFLTGLILLKMVDPKIESPVLRDYSISFTMYSLVSFILFPLSFGILIHVGLTAGIVFFVLMLLLFVSGIYFVQRRKIKSSSAA